MATFEAKYNIGDSLYYILRNGKVKKAEVIIITFNKNLIDYKVRLDDGDMQWLSCSTLCFYRTKDEVINEIKKELENIN